MAKIKANAIGNYLGQGFTIIVTLICTPLYLQFLGAEAYGLVGFFIILQNWLNLLDMGLSTTLARQVSFARGQIFGFKHFKHLLKSFEIIFFTTATTIILLVYLQSNLVASEWIKAILLTPESISYCIIIMGIVIGLRFFSTLYRGGIIGFEDQIWLNKFLIIINSLKYIGSFCLCWHIYQMILNYFLNIN